MCVGAFDAAAYHQLRILAECFEDFQKVRIACGNRLLKKRPKGDESKRQPIFPEFAGVLTSTQAVEDDFGKRLRLQYRKTAPPGVLAWQREMRGVGEHLMARLLGHLGHPRIAVPYRWMEEPPAEHRCNPLRCGKDKHLVQEEPFARTIAQLRSYCGVGDPRRRRRKDMSQEQALACGSPRRKMLLRLLAESCVKAGTIGVAPSYHRPSRPHGETPTTDESNSIVETSESNDTVAIGQSAFGGQKESADRYRWLYDEARARYATRLHAEPCAPCHHAAVGSPWKPGHQHAAALRFVAKAILKDLWLAAGEAHVVVEVVRR